MIRSSVILLWVLLAFSLAMAGQSDPVLVTANIPMYPAIACTARIEGAVKVSFTLTASNNEPTQIEIVSGHPLLVAAAIDNVKSWRFINPYTVDRNYETTFTFRLSGRELASTAAKRLTVILESFRTVEIMTDAYETTMNYDQ
jgi:TonB family protein